MGKEKSKEERFRAMNVEKSKVAIRNMHYKDRPPQFVTVIGPARSGKTTLLVSLLEHLTATKIDPEVAPKGLITLSLANKRITLYEAKSSILSIIDSIKVSDVLLMTVSVNRGLERETLEAIHAATAHGPPKFIFIFTYDSEISEREPGDGNRYDYSGKIKHQKPKKTRKKEAGEREKLVKLIRKECPNPPEFFDLKKDDSKWIEKIARELILVKTRPIVWKCLHSHVVIDQFRDDYYYGYVRGGPLSNGTDVHVINHGDYKITSLEEYSDPCLPDRRKKPRIYAPYLAEKCTDRDMTEVAGQTPDCSEQEEVFVEEEDIRLFEDETGQNDDKLVDGEQREEEESWYSYGAGNDDIHEPVKASNGKSSREEEISGDEKGFSCENTPDGSPSDELSSKVPVDGKKIADNNALDETRIKRLRGRFKSTLLTEEEQIAKFETEYDSKMQKEGKNFLQVQKDQELARVAEIESCTGAILPGKYCRFKLFPCSDESEYKRSATAVTENPGTTLAKGKQILDDSNLMIVGAYLPGEKGYAFISGQATKDKYHKKDLKSNTPFFISVGWCRFQSIPVFCADQKAVKYLRSSEGARSADCVFYGPAVASGTGFFFFDPESRFFRILGSGHVKNGSISQSVKKKLKLVGFPEKIMGNNAIIQSMFASDKEVDKFLNAKLRCASGLRGIVKAPIGKGGHFRATFEGPMLMSDVVFLRCYVPLEPQMYLQHMRAGAEYVRIRPRKTEEAESFSRNAGSDSESSLIEEEEFSSEANDEWEKERPRKDHRERRDVLEIAIKRAGEADKPADVFSEKLRKEIKKLERDLPFERSRVTTLEQKIELPVSPEKRREQEEQKRIERKRRALEEEENRRRREERALREAKRKVEEEERMMRKKKLAIESSMKKNKRKRR